ncbi:amino acid adenylation domain-containing protein [Luteipulveratus flavus]|uniref:Amino acid adenylation domain-containing protein n=1 Tax=Luteipulveratus flavus TaxID=3031728 RepID=A0ABT6C730_9MICO|nr:non-ribosomal peptide synthetase [Luteipulveratus sp. YIM 133296]MDF8264580.1 amino acid adenylation domain-containing protein [Luteipulveratus sp. YIM 133296]
MTITTARNDYLPLTPLQDGLLFECEGRDDDPYVLQVVVELDERLVPERLHAAVDALLVRYPNLRACFRRRRNGQAVQVVPPHATVPWEVVDLTGLSSDAAAGEVERRTTADRTARFDLTDPPLLRATLLGRPDGSYRLLLAVHHLVLDGWSLPLLLQAVAQEYAGSGPLSRPDPAFRDFLGWLGGRSLDASLTAWSDALSGLASPTLLAADDGDPGRPLDRRTALVDARTTTLLTEWARREQVTLTTVLQVCWALVAGYATGSEDVVLGQVDSGRAAPVAGVGTAVGTLCATYPVRVRARAGTSIGDLAREVQAAALATEEHRYAGMGAIQRAAGVDALFDSLLTVQNYPMPDLDASAADTIPVQSVETFAGTGYAVTMTVLPVDHELELVLQVRARLRAGHSASSLLERFRSLLAVVAECDPASPVAALPVATPDERSGLIALGRGPEAYEGLPGDDLVAAIAARSDSVLVGEHRSWSGVELAAQSQRLARALVRRGIGPESLVGLAVPRTGEAVVAMLGVLSSGAAYVFFDPFLPPARLAVILDDAAPSLLVGTSERLAALTDHAVGVDRLALDELCDEMLDADAPTSDPVSDRDRTEPLRGGHPAYVIFTSGTTGRPKGVVVGHANLANTLRAYPAAVGGLTAADRMLAVTTFGFDIAHTEVLAPLLAGASIVLADEETVRDVDRLVALLRSSGTTVMQATPVHWRELCRQHPDALRGLTAVSGGEALPADLADEMVRRGALLHNLYGPTETTIWSTGGRVGEPCGEGPDIGRPIAGNDCRVLDAALRPVPVGVAGELYIGGPSVARGYRNRPALTASRFVADPWGAPGSRMYRTGDLAVWTADGRLRCLGRTDHQVKLRGHRIEPAEIEAVLCRSDAVDDAVVVLHHPAGTEPLLVAYVVAPAAASADIHEHARASLPSALVPSQVVTLDRMPLTTSGKIDRNALPSPTVVAAASGVAPRTPTESVLAEVFAEILEVEQVGVHDDFFARGGHSLLAARVVSRLRTITGVDVPPRTLFEAPSVAALAQRLQDAGPVGDRPERREPAAQDGELTAAQQRMWLMSRVRAGRSAYNVAVAVRLQGDLDLPALEQALTDVVDRHEPLRTTFPLQGGRPVQHVRPTTAFGVSVLDCPPEDVQRRLAEAAAAPFDLMTQLPVRATVLRVGAAEHVLSLVVHHIAVDGWSLGPLCADLSSAYADRRAGRSPQRPPVPVRYLDYVDWYARRLGDASDPESRAYQQLEYWRGQLAGAPDTLTLPADRPRPARPTGQGRRIPFRLDAEVHRDLLDLARRHGVTPFMVLHAALAATLTDLGAGTDVPIGTAVAGRDDDRLHDLVGLFVNTVVLRLDCSGSPSLVELAQRSRHTVLAAQEHQDVPFDAVVDALAVPRDTSRNPLFQVMLILQNTPAAALDLDGLTVGEAGTPEVAAKVDLALELTEQWDGTVPAGVDGGLDLATDLFDTTTANRVLERFRTVLLAGLHRPDAPLVPLAPAEGTLSERFETVVRRHGDRPALQWDGPDGPATWTYEDLAGRARRVARELAARDVGPGDVVGVLMARSAEALAAILGVMTAGAAYLPMDPAYPHERIAMMAQDAAPRVTLTTAAGRDLAESAGLADVVVLDDLGTAARIAAHPTSPLAPEEPARPARPADPAYVIFTSGSTGRPKGVVISQRSAHQFVRAQATLVRPRDGWRVLQTASLSFDASFWEIGLSLFQGGTAVIAGDRERAGAPLADLLRRYDVRSAVLPPVVIGSIPPDAELPDGLDILSAGEALPVETVNTYSRKLLLRNGYGPTESTVCASISAPMTPGSVPIGHAFPGRDLHVLDSRLQPVPDGSEGELYLAGQGLADGYLGRAALTAERFVACPYGRPGERMYRTGDLVRVGADGQLEYLGRADRQVKVNGHRVEPAETESALLAEDAVRQAVVHVWSAPGGSRELVAHVVADRAVDLRALRTRLAETLPPHQVPTSITAVDRIPLTVNGKIDHAALPAPTGESGADDRPSQDPVVEVVRAAFEHVLGRPVTAASDFFEVGGNSIRSVELVARLEDLGVEVEIDDVIEARTPERIAALASTGDAVSTAGGEVPGRDAFEPVLVLRDSDERPPLFCVHGGIGMSLAYLALLPHLDRAQPVVALQSPSLDPDAPLPLSVADAASHYVDEVVRRAPTGPVHLLGWSYGGLLVHEMAVQLTERGREVGQLAILDSFPVTRLDAPDEQHLLQEVLAYVGERDAQQGPLTVAGVVDVLRRTGGPLAGVGTVQVRRVLALARQHTLLAGRHRPRAHRGDAVLYGAMRGTGDDPHAVLTARLDSWRPYVAGELTAVPVDADHDGMMNPIAAQQITAHLRDRLTGSAEVQPKETR